jgi:hypothetical protein
MSSFHASLAPVGAPAAERPPRFLFAVYAEPAPDVMPRVLEQFAKRDLVPTRWHSTVVSGPRAELQIDVQVEGLAADTGHYIARCLAGMVNVREVLTSTV